MVPLTQQNCILQCMCKKLRVEQIDHHVEGVQNSLYETLGACNVDQNNQEALIYIHEHKNQLFQNYQTFHLGKCYLYLQQIFNVMPLILIHA